MRRFLMWVMCGLLLPGSLAAAAQSSAAAARSPTAHSTPEYKNPRGLAPPNGYSHVVVVGGGKLVFVAGQVALNAEGNMVGNGDFAAQVRQAFANLKIALASAGATPQNLVKLNYYVVGLTHDRLLAVRVARDAMVDR